MEMEIYKAFRKTGLEEDDARKIVESIAKEIDRRYELHAKQLATRGDVAEVKTQMAEMETRLTKIIADAQKWTIGTIIAGMAGITAIIKLMSQ